MKVTQKADKPLLTTMKIDEYPISKRETKRILNNSGLPIDVMDNDFDVKPNERPIIREYETIWQNNKEALLNERRAKRVIRKEVQKKSLGVDMLPIMHAIVVGSIQTNTQQMENAAERHLLSEKPGPNQIEAFLMDTNYGEKKWEMYKNLLSPREGRSPIFVEAGEAFSRGEAFEATRILSGTRASNDFGDDGSNTYVGEVKAGWVADLLGFNQPCLDKNVRREAAPFLRNRVGGNGEVPDDPYEYHFKNVGNPADDWMNYDEVVWMSPHKSYGAYSNSKHRPLMSQRFLANQVGVEKIGKGPEKDLGPEHYKRPWEAAQNELFALFGLAVHTIAENTDIPTGVVQNMMFLKGAQTNKVQQASLKVARNYCVMNKTNSALDGAEFLRELAETPTELRI